MVTVWIVLDYLSGLEGTARYAGLILDPAEGFSLQPWLFMPLGQKMAFYVVFAYFFIFSCSVVNKETKANKKKKKKEEKNII